MNTWWIGYIEYSKKAWVHCSTTGLHLTASGKIERWLPYDRKDFWFTSTRDAIRRLKLVVPKVKKVQNDSCVNYAYKFVG